jgi:low temperature requirement protein LtrA
VSTHISVPPRLRLPGKGEKRSATWLELFFDLVFVISVAELVRRLGHHISVQAVGQFIALFIPVWWCWVGHTVYATRFDTDDIIHRLLTFTMMFAAAIMAKQVPTAFETGSRGFAGGYVLARLCLLISYTRARLHVPEARKMTTLYLSGFGLGALFWLVSLLVSSPERFVLWAIGMGIDFIIPWLGRKSILQKAPLDTSHFPERFGLFTIIVLGETILAVVSGLSEAVWYWPSITAAILAFLLAVSIWYLYFSYIHKADHEGKLGSGQPFIYGHLPLVLALAAVGAGVRDVIMQAHESSLTPETKILLSAAIGIWIISFFLIQYVSIERSLLTPLRIPYSAAFLVTVLLCFGWHLPPLVVLFLFNFLFAVLLLKQLRVFGTLKRAPDHKN